jgi:hypothetical protein
MQAARETSSPSSRSPLPLTKQPIGRLFTPRPFSTHNHSVAILVLAALLVIVLARTLYPLSTADDQCQRLLKEQPDNESSEIVPNTRLTAQSGVVALYCGNEGWYARLGNNIMTVLGAAAEARFYGMQFGIKDCYHDVLNLTSLRLPDSKEILRHLPPEKAYFLHFIKYAGSSRQHDNGKDKDAGEFIFPAITPCISRDIVRPMLAHLAQRERKYSEDALVIHIRSGDIMPGGNHQVHPLYAPPPLSYYLDIIDQHLGSREVVIVAEKENMYPAVDRLMKLYPSIKLQTGSLEEDISVILGAKYLVASHSTFAWSLAIGSPSVELIYTFNNGLHVLDDRIFGGTKVIQYYTDDYIKMWVGSEEQMDYVLNYPRDQLKQNVYANDYPCDRILELFPVDNNTQMK